VYKIRVKEDFSAAHRIFQRNKCENLHGHNWEVEVCLKAEKLNKDGMIVDFREVKERLIKVLENLDHKYLNEVLSFSPTSENIAQYIFKQLEKDFKKRGCWLSAVSVKENKDVEAIYYERKKDNL